MKIVDLKNVKYKDTKSHESKEFTFQGKDLKKGMAGKAAGQGAASKLSYKNTGKRKMQKIRNGVKFSCKKLERKDAYTPVEIVLIVLIVLLIIGIILAGASIYLNYAFR